MLTRLTDKSAKALPAPARGNMIHWDTEVSGFGLRVTAAGARAFVLNYRTRAGRERRLTIGTVPSWNVTAARQEAGVLRRRVEAGEDPLEERRAARAAPTVGELCDDFQAVQVARLRPASRKSYGMALRHIRAALGRLKAAEVAFADVAKMHRHLTMMNGPYVANRCVAVAGRMFALAVRAGVRGDNPARGIERNHEGGRERYLTPAEMARLTATLATFEDRQAANLFTLLLLTGARVGEAMSAEWSQIDLDGGRWSKPSSHTKQKRAHTVPLSPAAVELLAAMPRTSRFVFPGRRPDTPMKAYQWPWEAVCSAADIEGLRVHDLRHSFASTLAGGGASLPIIGALLGHTQPNTTARYAHLLDDPLREAATKAGEVITGARKEGKVVAIRGPK